MKHSTALTALLSFFAAGPVMAGGIEQDCIGTLELWAGTPPSAINMTIRLDVTGEFAPGMWRQSCMPPFVPVTEHPLQQSVERAMQAWNNSMVASVDVASCSFAPAAASYISMGPADTSILGLGLNVITLWEPSSTFDPMGGPLTLAITPVNFVGSAIADADIALNVRGTTGNFGDPAYWSFLEENVLLGVTLGTRLSGNSFQTPLIGFADIEGILTHELGHVLGLGHSLIDAEAGPFGSRFPCMFPVAQTEPFTALIDDPPYSCNGTWTGPYTVSYLDVPSKGILGRSARIVSPDDAAALGQGYPTAGFTASLGTISGTVFDENAQAVPGASVVAFAEGDPEGNRVSTITYSGGAYSIGGLKPNTSYLVYVEPVDQNPNAGQASSGYYFEQADMPSYVDILLSGPSACVPAPPVFPMEFWNSGEAAVEASNMTATAIAVTAGNVHTANFIVNTSDKNLLKVVERGTMDTPSGRGAMVTGSFDVGTGVTNYPLYEIQVHDALRPFEAVKLLFSTERTARYSSDGQAILVYPSTSQGLPGSIASTLDASGSFTYTIQPTGPQSYRNLFVQAKIGTTVEYSNPVNLWVDR